MVRITMTALCVLLLSGSAKAETLTLFGQDYDVRRFDYAMEFTFPNPNPAFSDFFPEIAMLEIETARYIGNNQLILASEKMSALSYKSIGVIVNVEFDPNGAPAGLAYDRTLFWQDPPLPGNPGFDLSPSGVA